MKRADLTNDKIKAMPTDRLMRGISTINAAIEKLELKIDRFSTDNERKKLKLYKNIKAVAEREIKQRSRLL